MQISKPPALQKNSPEEQPQNPMRFHNSLQELRDLRSQLHCAADYWEATFLRPGEKKTVVEENTKEYICRAVVALVDHIGCVSTNLNHSISQTNQFSEAQLRIDTLKQRLLLCEQYAQRLALGRVRWAANLPKFHRRYLSTQITGFDKSEEENIRDPNTPGSVKMIYKHGYEAEDLPFMLYTYPEKPSLTRQASSNSPSVRDGISILSKGSNSKFHFQQNSEKHGRYKLFRKSLHSHDFLSLVRRIKWTT
ncbi:probable protein ABIL5 [Euphorbia lathyris]|uniref:probable protein ABIL5 n=1 Tax=Euphorbia lathyris TaxID=212925 RepID=UPI003313CC6B